MKRDVAPHLKHDFNLPVLRFLDGKSSHGDLSERFCKTIKDLVNAETFTPADRPYAYYFAYVDSTIFGFSESMKYITLLLPEHLHDDAISKGAVPHMFLSNKGWFDFPAFGSMAHSVLVEWTKTAYQNALKIDKP